MPWSLRRLSLVLTLCTLGVWGCSGFVSNPSYFPHLLPPGEITRTHAKPPGAGYFADFDPHAHTLVVRPVEITNPVRTRQVLLATVYDEKGQPRRSRRVEWMVEGAGQIEEVDESGLFSGRGYKVDNRYAVSYTDWKEHCISRGNDNANDDFVVRPGQSWCVVSSPVEGDTHVTVYAPGIHSWERSRVHVTLHWVDARWSTPEVVARASGTTHVFTTNVVKQTDKRPLSGYRVRYRILDGPPAVFLPARTPEVVTTSDLTGNASAAIVQESPAVGTNRVAVEIIRAPDPSATSASGLVIGRTETRIDWQAPGISLNLDGPPAVALGQEASYMLTINNTGKLESRSMTVRSTVPEGFQYVRSDPPANIEGDQLIWTLGELQGGQNRTVAAVFKSTKPDRVTLRASVVTEERLRDEKSVLTAVTQPGLKLALSGPPSGAVGSPVSYSIAISNPGTGATSNVVLKATLDEGLQSDAGANPIELRLPAPLGPGESRTIPLPLLPRKSGSLAVRLTATADCNLSDQASASLQVEEPKLTVRLSGPSSCYLRRPVTWDLEAANGGTIPLVGVALRTLMPPELEFVSATDGGQLTGREVVWNLGTLKPGEQKRVQMTTTPVTLSPGAVTRASVTAAPDPTGPGAAGPSASVRVETEAKLEIRGLPAYRLNVTARDNPVEVGGKTVYLIEVANQGSLEGKQVQVTTTVPQQMRILEAKGLSAHTIDGQKVTFAPQDGLQPQQTWSYTIEVQATSTGDARLQAELRASTLGEPVVVQKGTTIYSPNGPRPPAP